MINQFVYTIRQNRLTWLIYAGALFVIQVALAAVLKQAGASLPGGMGQLINLLPDAVRGFIGTSELDLLSANGALAVAYNHPLTKLMLAVFAVSLSANSIAGELERGTLDLLLARPLRRYQLLLGDALALLLASFILGGIMLVGTFIGAQIGGIGNEVTWSNFSWTALNAVALVLAMSGLGFLFSALAQRGGQAVWWTGGLIAIMFFLNWFAAMWDKVEPFAPLSFYYYYQPDKIISSTPNWWLNITALAVVTVVTFAGAAVIFERRDLTR